MTTESDPNDGDDSSVKTKKSKKKKVGKKSAPAAAPPSTASHPSPTTAIPPRVKTGTVTFLGVRVAPWKADHTPWDGVGTPAEDDVRALGEALTDLRLGALEKDPTVAAAATVTRAVGALTTVLSRPTVSAFQAVEKPDLFGTARVIRGTRKGPQLTLEKIGDSFTPQWSNIEWEKVPLDGTARIEISLQESDVARDDPAGIFYLGKAELLLAAASGKAFEVGVADQTDNQILLAKIAVLLDGDN